MEYTVAKIMKAKQTLIAATAAVISVDSKNQIIVGPHLTQS